MPARRVRRKRAITALNAGNFYYRPVPCRESPLAARFQHQTFPISATAFQPRHHRPTSCNGSLIDIEPRAFGVQFDAMVVVRP